MMLTIRFSPRAERDLDDIRKYIAERNPRAAERVRLRIGRTLGLLATFPHLGRSTSKKDVLMTTVPRYAYKIYYSVSDQEIFVLHIRHRARRDPKIEGL